MGSLAAKHAVEHVAEFLFRVVFTALSCRAFGAGPPRPGLLVRPRFARLSRSGAGVGLGRVVADLRFGARGLVIGATAPLVDLVALGRDDLVELFFDGIEGSRRVIPVEHGLAFPLHLLDQPAETIEPAAVGQTEAALQQVAERLARIAGSQQIVGQLVQNLLGREIRHLLGAVPRGIPDGQVRVQR